ncbi:transposable element Tcb1 transposase [Trichonephila clavipes]|nr:transposable element Tcb1 transposase [Trichonephila clavipes]
MGNNGNLVLGPFDESTPCLMIVLMNCQTKLRINHLTALKSVAILERKSVVVLHETKQLSCGYVTVGCRRIRRTDVVDRVHLKAPLHQSGLSARRPLFGLPLTHNHRRLRHQWYDERRMWGAEWKEIIFIDESRICLQHHDGRIQVWRHRGERMLISCVMHHHFGPAPGIMVWSGIRYHSHTPLVRIAGTLNIAGTLYFGASCPSLPSGLGHSHISS